MVVENSYGLITVHMMVNSIKIIFMASENMYGPTEELMMVSGSITKWKVLAHLLGLMEGDTKVNTSTIKNTVKEHLSGQTVVNI